MGNDRNYRTGQHQIALAELFDKRRKDHNDNDLRDILREVEHAVILVIAQNVLRIVGCAGAVDRLVYGKEERGQQDQNEIFIMEQRAEPHTNRQLFRFLCCLRTHTLFRTEETPQKQRDCDHRINQRDLDPCGLVAAHAVDDRQRCRGYNHVADRRHGHTEQVDFRQILLVARHQRRHRAVRQVERRVNDRCTQVIGYKNVDTLYDCRCISRQAEQCDRCNAVRQGHPEHPCAAAAMLGMHLVHDQANRHVGQAVKNTGHQHDHTDHSGRYAHDVGVEVGDKAARQGEHDVTGHVAHAV